MTAEPRPDGAVLPLDQLRFVQSADVYKRGDWAGLLTRTRDGVEFAYVPDWVVGRRPPVASTLPVRTEPFLRPGGALPAYFSGLLPEGRRLGALRRTVKTSVDDELSLLLAVGADAVGDVQVVPAGELPMAVPPRLSASSFTETAFSDLLAEMGIRADRTALPGVQDKVSAAMLNLPLSRAGEMFILKLNPPEFPHLVENEAFFLSAARLSGLSMVTADLVHDAAGEAGLLVHRFDRTRGDERLMSLAVEDACQALDRPPGDKYLVSSEDALGALASLCGAPRVAARTFVAQLVFAYLTGNGDAHAKNFSVVQTPDGEWRASPAYDVPSSYPYGDSTLSMSLGGRTTGDFRTADFVALGATLGLPERAVRSVVAKLVDRVDSWLPRLPELPFDLRRKHKLMRLVEHRRTLLQSR